MFLFSIQGIHVTLMDEVEIVLVESPIIRHLRNGMRVRKVIGNLFAINTHAHVKSLII